MTPEAPDLTDDSFLDGRLKLLQPRVGYRAATDPVLLAAAVPAGRGDSVLELGCGAGAAALCLAVRVPGLARLAGVEIQPAYAALARRNAARNAIALEVHEGDVAAMPAGLRGQVFDHVLANPPFFPPDAPAAADAGRDRALRESLPVGVWVDAGLRRLRSGGTLTMIHRVARLPQILGAAEGRASVQVLPLQPRIGRDAGRMLVQARKGGRAEFRLLAPLVLHDGASHCRDGDDFSNEAMAILRDAAPISGFRPLHRARRDPTCE